MDYNYFINPLAARRKPQITRELTKYLYNAPKEAISLAEGMPNELTFPFEQITISLKDGQEIALQGPQLGAALQYIPTQGYPPLVQLLKEFTKRVHLPPNWAESELLVTSGSQDGISRAIEMCLHEGDPVLIPNPLYAGIETVLYPHLPTQSCVIPIDQDQYGMVPKLLEEALAKRHEKCLRCLNTKMPKFIYINPTGSNPTGTTIPLERRKEIYEICCKYNIIILEDDAYCFMYFQATMTPSFLSLDVEGRVIRFDSFSKVLSSGLRVGWLTGSKQLVKTIELHIQSSCLHSSTLSQVIVYNLLNLWGYEKLLEHFDSIRAYYKARRDIIIASMERHLNGLCEWTVPSGGMFVWFKVHDVSDVYEMLMTRGQKKMITFVPGHAFMANPAAACNYIRASYSKASPKQIDRAMKLLADLIREEKVLLKKKFADCI